MGVPGSDPRGTFSQMSISSMFSWISQKFLVFGAFPGFTGMCRSMWFSITTDTMKPLARKCRYGKYNFRFVPVIVLYEHISFMV